MTSRRNGEANLVAIAERSYDTYSARARKLAIRHRYTLARQMRRTLWLWSYGDHLRIRHGASIAYARGGQPLTAVPYEMAIDKEGVVFEETEDAACKGGVCGA